MKERSLVVVSRQNDKLEIKHTVVHAADHIRIEMDLDNFLDHLAYEVGPGVNFTRNGLAEKLKAKSEGVIRAMKESTKYGPPPKKVTAEK